MKLSLFLYNIVAYTENPEESAEKPLELLSLARSEDIR